MTRLALAIVSLTPACVVDEVPVHLVGEVRDGDRELVEEAASILGLDARFVTWEYGAIQLELRDECDDEHCGLTQQPTTPVCHGLDSWSIREAETLSHEFGHALGLKHVEDEGNLMFPPARNMELTDEQMDDMADRVALLNACR